MKSGCNKLSVLGLGMAIGLTWAISMFLLGLCGWLFSYGLPIVGLMGSIYMGFHPTLMGSLIGLVLGFVDGFIGGVFIAWFYNLFCKCCHKNEPQNQ